MYTVKRQRRPLTGNYNVAQTLEEKHFIELFDAITYLERLYRVDKVLYKRITPKVKTFYDESYTEGQRYTFVIDNVCIEGFIVEDLEIEAISLFQLKRDKFINNNYKFGGHANDD